MTNMPELDYRMLDRELDRVKTKVFLGKNAAFLGPLMCSMNFIWSQDIETAATDGINLLWNPHFFLSLAPEVRQTILLHELWHPGFLHMVRRGNRDPKIWNYAADIVINNMLDDEGYSFTGLNPWLDHQYDGWVTEDIYDDLITKDSQMTLPPPQWVNPISGKADDSDIIEDRVTGNHTIINNVVAATHSANISGQGYGNIPGEIELTLKQFLSPKLPWEQILYNFFNELQNQDYSWRKPSRRYRDMYLPGMVDDDGGLDHIAYFLDVSGSISDAEITRFHSEFKYVKERFEPQKMTMLQFDTRITSEKVFEKEDPFEETHVVGRGGTNLAPVREWIIENEPTAVVIFSDLWCPPMEPLPRGMDIPIIWIALNNKNAEVNMGQLVHLTE